MNKTKIIATLGPRTNTEEQISALIEAGMDVARINLSHGNREGHAALIGAVQRAREKLGRNTAILLDTRGPEIRVEEMDQPLLLVEGEDVVVAYRPKPSEMTQIRVNFSGIAINIRAEDDVLLDDGKMALRVLRIEGDAVIARVVAGGLLVGRKRVSLPGVEVDLPPLSPEDRDDILFGVAAGVDFFAASFIRRREDVECVRQVIRGAGGEQHLIAKIENKQGVANLEAILEAADGVMVARGDLGVELPPEEVPVIQKRIIRAANDAGKPVITATQMLESMISSPTPTRAEATDVTNAVYDGTDAVMLSGETAMGKYPVQAIRFLCRCTHIAESSLDYRTMLSSGLAQRRAGVSDAIAYASCAIAADLNVAAILCVTTSGSTARKVAKYRPQSPIIGLSPVVESLRKLQVIRDVVSLACEPGTTMDTQIEFAVTAAVAAGIVKEGDVVVITAGVPLQTTGTTNMVRVHTIAAGGRIR